MNKILLAFFSSILFSLGLGISQMTNPGKVVGYLDFFGDWDPSLMFVMIGGIAVNAIIYRIVKNRQSPIFDFKFVIPSRKDIDKSLIIGAALFGIGWGIGGFCPGPALASIPSNNSAIYIFVVSMIIGIRISQVMKAKLNM